MTNSGCQRRVIVAGGSVGGLFLGNLLAKSGWRVDIFERASDALLERDLGLTYDFILRESARLPRASAAAAAAAPHPVH